VVQVREISTDQLLLTYQGHKHKQFLLTNQEHKQFLFTNQGHDRQVNTLAWSPNGKWLASGTWDGIVHIWEASSGRLLRSYDGGKDDMPILALAWSYDGERLAMSFGTTVQVREIIGDRLVYTYRWHADSHTSTGNVTLALAWSPNGRLLHAHTNYLDNRVWVWDTNRGEPLFIYQGHNQHVMALAWSPDGTWLASSSADATVQIWEANSGRWQLTYHGHTNQINALAWSPDGTQLASGGIDQTVQVWQAR
jgi:WD40 repeat protein